MAKCDICGVSSFNIGLAISKAMGTGDLKKCSVCGLTYCTNCAVSVTPPTGFITKNKLVKMAACPRCNPNGWRGDRRW